MCGWQLAEKFYWAVRLEIVILYFLTFKNLATPLKNLIKS
jgi:hypothetical protein